MKRPSWKLLASLLAILLFAAACSEQQPADEATVDQAPAATVEEAAPAAVAPAETQAEVPQQQADAGEAAYPVDQPESAQPIDSFGEVAGQLWVLVAYGDALNPIVVPEGTVVTATFDSAEGQVTGNAGCNNYFAGFTSTNDGGLTVNGPIGATMMACPEGMDIEAAYLAALENVTGWTINENGRLELPYSSGQPYAEQLVFAPGETPLTGVVWQLVNFGDPENPTELEEGTTVTAVFLPETDTTGTISGSATCNNYSGGYTLDGGSISFSPIASTMMMCPSGMEQETAYLAALQGAQTFEMSGRTLRITYDGGVLTYSSLNLPLEHVLWQVVTVGGEAVPEDVTITALFTPGDVAGSGALGGNAGCNHFSTSYETSSDLSTNPATNSISIASPMAMTMMLCPDETLSALESSYIEMLGTAETFEILGEQMVMHTANGDIQFAADRQPLLGTLWTLISLGDAEKPEPPVEGSRFTATFNRLPNLPTGTVTGETGCNDYNATFAADLTSIKINLPQKSNNEECPWGTGDFVVEQQYFLGLNAATSYRILGDNLQLLSGEGETAQVMNFVATQPEIEPEPEVPALDLTPLAGTFWYLSAMGDTPILSGTEITAAFEVNEDGVTGAVSGSAGCNAYNADIGPNFAVGPVATTQKACEPAVMSQESTYLTWLGSAYDFDRAGDQLLVSTANGVLIFNSSPILDQARELQNGTWYVISYGSLTAIAGSNPTARFAADGSTLNGNTGCNEYNGAYRTEQGNSLTISGIASTKAACTSDALARQEETFLRLMPAAVSYRVSGTQLQIVTADGGTMNFTSIPPQAPVPPTAVIVSGDFADTGQQLTFDGSQSRAGSVPITRFQWDMGDGTQLSGPTVKYTYNTAGTYTVTLTVTDQAGLQGSTTRTIQVNPVVEVTPPVAVIEGPATAFVGEVVTF
ncbi:MAG: META domain-containing protein, partial [Candidatus Promineifilaceae bacterium]